MEWPAAIKQNVINTDHISMLDITATFFEILAQGPNVEAFTQLQGQLEGESLLAVLTQGVIGVGVPQLRRSKPIFICEQCEMGKRVACPAMAVILSDLKLIVNVKQNGIIDKSSAQLWDIEAGESSPLSNTHPLFESMVDLADKWARSVVVTAIETCRFSGADELL